MQCGPKGAHGYLQDFIRDILLGRIGKDTATYLNNIMAYRKKAVDHAQAVAESLKIPSKHNLSLKPEKCKFSWSKFKSLWAIISDNRIRMYPIKVKAVAKWPEPRHFNKFQWFINFSTFFQKSIDHFYFLAITQLLHDLKKADSRSTKIYIWQWT